MPPSDDYFPPTSTPRKVTGGIRAQATGARPGASWWSRRWMAALESFGIGERIERGRAYARGGQVVSLDIDLGRVSAVVQGTRKIPYETSISVSALTQEQWLGVAAQLAARARATAQLLAGDMPDDIEAVFARSGVSLFPVVEDDLELTCTCTDWATPCKHVGAVCYLLGESFDRDPFLLFHVRGIERALLLALVGGGVTPAAADKDVADMPGGGELEATFWSGASGSDDDIVLDLESPAITAPVVRVLGPVPLWRGVDDLESVVGRAVAGAASSTRVVDIALGAATIESTS